MPSSILSAATSAQVLATSPLGFYISLQPGLPASHLCPLRPPPGGYPGSFLKHNYGPGPWLVWLSGLSTGLRTKGSLVQFPIRAHAWVAGQVPSGGHMRGNHTLMFLSLSFSLPSPLSKNK